MFFAQSTGGFYSLEIHGDSMPSDAVEISEEIYLDLLEGQATGQRIVADAQGYPGLAPQLPPTFEQIRARLVVEIQQRLDTFARTRNYDGILSACTYAQSTVPAFLADGLYAVAARDATWSAAYAILAEVQAETRVAPTVLAEIEAELPPLQWPQ